eukprot:scaffold47009_cov20-Tisochrysis_lutea.AAC.1
MPGVVPGSMYERTFMVLSVEKPGGEWMPVVVPGTRAGTKPLEPAGSAGGIGRLRSWLSGRCTSLKICGAQAAVDVSKGLQLGYKLGIDKQGCTFTVHPATGMFSGRT